MGDLLGLSLVGVLRGLSRQVVLKKVAELKEDRSGNLARWSFALLLAIIHQPEATWAQGQLCEDTKAASIAYLKGALERGLTDLEEGRVYDGARVVE